MPSISHSSLKVLETKVNLSTNLILKDKWYRFCGGNVLRSREKILKLDNVCSSAVDRFQMFIHVNSSDIICGIWDGLRLSSAVVGHQIFILELFGIKYKVLIYSL